MQVGYVRCALISTCQGQNAVCRLCVAATQAAGALRSQVIDLVLSTDMKQVGIRHLNGGNGEPLPDTVEVLLLLVGPSFGQCLHGIFR